MNYRKSRAQDLNGVYRLVCALEERSLPLERFSEIYLNQLADKRYFCLVCEEGEKILGVLNMRFEEQLHHTEYIAEILEFAVDFSRRSEGIGKKMLETACKTAAEFGCTQIEAACNQLRTDTHRFYLREGMNNFHFRFSKSLAGSNAAENAIGR